MKQKLKWRLTLRMFNECPWDRSNLAWADLMLGCTCTGASGFPLWFKSDWVGFPESMSRSIWRSYPCLQLKNWSTERSCTWVPLLGLDQACAELWAMWRFTNNDHGSGLASGMPCERHLPPGWVWTQLRGSAHGLSFPFHTVPPSEPSSSGAPLCASGLLNTRLLYWEIIDTQQIAHIWTVPFDKFRYMYVLLKPSPDHDNKHSHCP